MEIFPGVIDRENEHYLPFLLATTFLMEAVKGGVGREEAHELVKEHALAAVKTSRSAGGVNDLESRIKGDPRLGLSSETVDELMANGRSQVGRAEEQIKSWCALVAEIAASDAEAAAYRPGAIL